MAWLAIDKDGRETIYERRPSRGDSEWFPHTIEDFIELPKGSIHKLIGRELTWEDEPVELKDEE